MKLIIDYSKKISKTKAQKISDNAYKKNLILGIIDLSYGTFKKDELNKKSIPQLEKLFDNCQK